MPKFVEVILSRITLTIEKEENFSKKEVDLVFEDVVFCIMFPTQHGCTIAQIWRHDKNTNSVILSEMINYVLRMKSEYYE